MYTVLNWLLQTTPEDVLIFSFRFLKIDPILHLVITIILLKHILKDYGETVYNEDKIENDKKIF